MSIYSTYPRRGNSNTNEKRSSTQKSRKRKILKSIVVVEGRRAEHSNGEKQPKDPKSVP
jgi:hypothetical protein